MAATAHPVDPVAPAEILKRLPGHWAAAKESGDLFFFESTTRHVGDQYRFTVTICPALAAKIADIMPPKEPEPEVKRVRTDAAERPSPFRPPYVPGLYVGCVPGIDGEDVMSVLLNKFAVLPEHFLLCPTTEQPQSLPPTPGQIARVLSIIQAGARSSPPRRLFAFYNGGPGAGASQRWRHVQFIDGPAPVEEWTRSVVFERNDRPVIHPGLPYLHIIHPLPATHNMPYPPSEEDLAELADRVAPALMRSLDLAFDALRRSGGDRNQGWNMLITDQHLHLIPRSAPQFALAEGVPPLDLNALGYAGMLLVKSQEEDAALDAAAAQTEGGVIGILGKCAIPREFGEQALEAESIQHGGAGDQ